MTSAISAVQQLHKADPGQQNLAKGKSTGGLGGFFSSKIGRALLFAGAGAAAGAVIPVIPGGPLGGALIGAALALIL